MDAAGGLKLILQCRPRSPPYMRSPPVHSLGTHQTQSLANRSSSSKFSEHVMNSFIKLYTDLWRFEIFRGTGGCRWMVRSCSGYGGAVNKRETCFEWMSSPLEEGTLAECPNIRCITARSSQAHRSMFTVMMPHQVTLNAYR